MRPIRRGSSPQPEDFDLYEKAKPELISRLGGYCSYCERCITTNLAVEHIQPKGLPIYSHLVGRWDNFLLGCVNCNSTKGSKDVQLDHILLPDRDNTFKAFDYIADGTITISLQARNAGKEQQAKDTLALTGLDKHPSNVLDQNGKRVALDRVSQRLQAWGNAKESKKDLLSQPDNEALRRSIIRNAVTQGFFSIWMNVFQDDVDMRNRLIDEFPGTRDSECFYSVNALPVSPAPNPDNLAGGGKI